MTCLGDLAKLIRSKNAGPFNLTAPEPPTNKSFSRTLGRVLRRPSFMPAPACRLAVVPSPPTPPTPRERAASTRRADLCYRVVVLDGA